VSQELNQALSEASQDPQTAGYCQEIVMILEARQRGELSREEAEYLLKEMAEVRLAQTAAATEKGVRWTVQAISLAAKLI
jgi:hypothetical protein